MSTTRRDFIKTTSGVLAAALWPVRLPPAQAEIEYSELQWLDLREQEKPNPKDRSGTFSVKAKVKTGQSGKATAFWVFEKDVRVLRIEAWPHPDNDEQFGWVLRRDGEELDIFRCWSNPRDPFMLELPFVGGIPVQAGERILVDVHGKKHTEVGFYLAGHSS